MKSEEFATATKADEARVDDTQMLSKESDAVANSSLFTHHSSLPKSERIVSKKLMEELFSGKGNHSKVVFPLRMVFMERQRPEGEPAAQVLISVSKRHFKHAVDRNRVKRQIREAYRLQKHLVIDHISPDRQLLIAFIWLSDGLAPSVVIRSRVKRLLNHIAESLSS